MTALCRTPHLTASSAVSVAFAAPMEVEVRAVCDPIRRVSFPASVAIVADVHSGFGTVDRFWLPYARTRALFPCVSEVAALKHLLDKTYPCRIYCVEPQSRQCVTHADLWDLLYRKFREHRPHGRFLPFTLELGSWLSVKKDWWQLFDRLGAFNPYLPHREQTALSRHLHLFDFIYRAVQSPSRWAGLSESARERFHAHATSLWHAKGD